MDEKALERCRERLQKIETTKDAGYWARMYVEDMTALLKENIVNNEKRYEDALWYVKSELVTAERNAAYKKETLITVIRDRIDAALREGSYKPRENVTEKVGVLNADKELGSFADTNQMQKVTMDELKAEYEKNLKGDK